MHKQLRFAIIFGSVKRALAISFVFLLSAQCIFKLTIITYFEANRDYIAEVLCINKKKEITLCYGQCFLDRNLAIADERNDDQATSTNKTQIETSIFLITDFHWYSKKAFLLRQKFDSRELLYAYDLTHTLFHPPC